MYFRSLLTALLLLSPLCSRAAPDVVVSIAPIHSLAAGVMRGIGSPRLLLPAGASPHSYALLPSDARALSKAALVVWVGPDLERFLLKPLGSLASDARILELARLPGLTVLETRDGAGHGGGEDHDEEGESDRAHAHGGEDTHLWLDPLNAAAIVLALADVLAKLDPAQAAGYRNNAQALHQRLLDLDARTRQALTPVRDRPFVVFHDAYHYFEHRYDLHAVGILTLSPDRQPGAQRVAETRERITRLGARCVFREPQFESALVQTLVEGTSAKVAVLDPLGAALEPGPDAYFQLIDALTASLVGCLGKA